jgi:hypothetical protein
VPDLGVHGVGKIQGRRPARQLDDPAPRGQDIDMGLERLGPDMLDDPLGGDGARARVTAIRAVGSEKALEPGDPIPSRTAAFLVTPMRGYAELGVSVHGVGADLHLHAIQDHRDYDTHLDYIDFNPVKHGWVPRVADWPHSIFH